MIKAICSIIGTVSGFSGLFSIVVAVCLVYKNHWKYMGILRKIFIKNKPAERQIKYELCKCCCGFLQVCCWHSCIFCCQYCKYEIESDFKIENYELDQWGKFVEETVSIRRSSLNNMIESYISYKYNHQYYCYEHDNVYPSHECNHATSIMKKRLLRYTVLYLIELDFKKSKGYREIMKEPKEQSNLQYNQPIDYLKFIFRSVIEGASDRNEIRNAYQDIEISLQDKFKHLCLVLMNFPKDYNDILKPEEKFLLEAVQKIRREYNIQLIYCLG